MVGYPFNWGSLLFLMCVFGIQAVIKQFSTSGYESSHVVVIDEVEMQMHQHLEKLYRSTRSGRVRMLFLSSFL